MRHFQPCSISLVAIISLVLLSPCYRRGHGP